MLKTMIFIDGTWLYLNKSRLSEVFGDDSFHVDFGKLPNVLASEVSRRLGDIEVDIVRTYLFGSYAVNFDLRDEDIVSRRREFFDMLKEEYHYEVLTFPINFRGRRIRRSDRDPRDSFEPKEKYVDIALASSMLYYASIQGAYDIGLAVIGDGDFIPMLQTVRRLGKRIAITSIRSSCAPELSDPRDEAHVKDLELVWLDDLLQNLELKYERHMRRCESPIHRGNPMVWTTFRPRRGQQFFCDECRTEFQRQKREALSQYVINPGEQTDATNDVTTNLSMPISGTIKRLFPQKVFGFITGEDGKDYFFHLTDLRGMEFEELVEGDRVTFEIEKPASLEKAGSAQNVSARSEDTEIFQQEE